VRNFVGAYFTRVLSYPLWRFILELTVVCFIAKVISSIVLGAVLYQIGLKFYSADLDFNKNLIQTNMLLSILSIPFFAIQETLWGQAFLLWVSSKFTSNDAIRITFATILFSLAHVDIFQIIAVWPIAAILTWVFITKRKQSFWSAFWITSTIHILHNYLAMLFLWISLR